jgi:hypothetical protein
MEAAACAKPATGYTYARREPEKTALYQVLQEHLPTFEQEWTDKSDGTPRTDQVSLRSHPLLEVLLTSSTMDATLFALSANSPRSSSVRSSSMIFSTPPRPSTMGTPR